MEEAGRGRVSKALGFYIVLAVSDGGVLRFLGVTADEEYGGLAMGYQAHCTVLEEISRASGKYNS